MSDIEFNMPRSKDEVCIFGSDFREKFYYQNILFVIVSVLIWVETFTYAMILPLHYSAESISVECGRLWFNIEAVMLSNVATAILFYFSRKYYDWYLKGWYDRWWMIVSVLINCGLRFWGTVVLIYVEATGKDCYDDIFFGSLVFSTVVFALGISSLIIWGIYLSCVKCHEHCSKVATDNNRDKLKQRTIELQNMKKDFDKTKKALEEAKERANVAEEKLQEEKTEVALPVDYVDSDRTKSEDNV